MSRAAEQAGHRGRGVRARRRRSVATGWQDRSITIWDPANGQASSTPRRPPRRRRSSSGPTVHAVLDRRRRAGHRVSVQGDPSGGEPDPHPNADYRAAPIVYIRPQSGQDVDHFLPEPDGSGDWFFDVGAQARPAVRQHEHPTRRDGDDRTADGRYPARPSASTTPRLGSPGSGATGGWW